MYDVDKAHLKEYSENPEVIVEVPQVTTLLGGFSNYISGYSIMSTNDGGLRVAVSRRSDNIVKAINVTKQDKKKFVISNIKYRKEDRWANAIKALIQAFNATGVRTTGLNITIKGESAQADNISLSASVYAAVALALNEFNGNKLKYEKLLSICFKADELNADSKVRKQDLIMLFNNFKNQLVYFDLENYSYVTMANPFEKELSFKPVFLTPSLPSAVLNPVFDEFREDIEKVCEHLEATLSPAEKLRDIPERNLRLMCTGLSENQKRYAHYLLEESNVAKEAWKVLKRGDLKQFAKLLNQQQKNITTRAELTCPEIDWIVRRGSEADEVLALVQVSSGIAGMMFSIIVEKEGKKAFEKLEEYERIFGFHPAFFEYIPSGGLRVI